jgi:hypothetical protein
VVYTDSFKAKMVQRMSAPNAISAMNLSKEGNVSRCPVVTPHRIRGCGEVHSATLVDPAVS